MQIENEYLKAISDEQIAEVVAKKILKERKTTYKQRFWSYFTIGILVCTMLTAVIICGLCTETEHIKWKDYLVLIAGDIIFFLYFLFRSRKVARKGSIYADAMYDWVNKYDDGEDEAHLVKMGKGRKAYGYRTPSTPEEKADAKRGFIRICLTYLPIYILGLGAFTTIARYDSTQDLLLQIVYGWGVAFVYFLIVMCMIILGTLSTIRMYKSPKYDKYYEYYLEHGGDSEDE